jgi:hypothetical protein
LDFGDAVLQVDAAPNLREFWKEFRRFELSATTTPDLLSATEDPAAPWRGRRINE